MAVAVWDEASYFRSQYRASKKAASDIVSYLMKIKEIGAKKLGGLKKLMDRGKTPASVSADFFLKQVESQNKFWTRMVRVEEKRRNIQVKGRNKTLDKLRFEFKRMSRNRKVGWGSGGIAQNILETGSWLAIAGAMIDKADLMQNVPSIVGPHGANSPPSSSGTPLPKGASYGGRRGAEAGWTTPSRPITARISEGITSANTAINQFYEDHREDMVIYMRQKMKGFKEMAHRMSARFKEFGDKTSAMIMDKLGDIYGYVCDLYEDGKTAVEGYLDKGRKLGADTFDYFKGKADDAYGELATLWGKGEATALDWLNQTSEYFSKFETGELGDDLGKLVQMLVDFMRFDWLRDLFDWEKLKKAILSRMPKSVRGFLGIGGNSAKEMADQAMGDRNYLLSLNAGDRADVKAYLTNEQQLPTVVTPGEASKKANIQSLLDLIEGLDKQGMAQGGIVTPKTTGSAASLTQGMDGLGVKNPLSQLSEVEKTGFELADTIRIADIDGSLDVGNVSGGSRGGGSVGRGGGGGGGGAWWGDNPANVSSAQRQYQQSQGGGTTAPPAATPTVSAPPAISPPSGPMGTAMGGFGSMTSVPKIAAAGPKAMGAAMGSFGTMTSSAAKASPAGATGNNLGSMLKGFAGNIDVGKIKGMMGNIGNLSMPSMPGFTGGNPIDMIKGMAGGSMPFSMPDMSDLNLGRMNFSDVGAFKGMIKGRAMEALKQQSKRVMKAANLPNIGNTVEQLKSSVNGLKDRANRLEHQPVSFDDMGYFIFNSGL